MRNEPEVRDAAGKICSAQGVDLSLVLAFCSVESNFNSHAVRYEDHYKWLLDPAQYASRNGITVSTETVCQKMSWGPMQIMGAVARERGFQGELTELTDPRKSLYFSILHLKMLLGRYKLERDAIAAYNAGSPTRDKFNLYTNQAYVDKVSVKAIQYRQITKGE